MAYELVEILADEIRRLGAIELAREYERGEVGLGDVYARLPSHAEALKLRAESLTLAGYYAYMSSPRAYIGWRG